jgi:hypothetical protein
VSGLTLNPQLHHNGERSRATAVGERLGDRVGIDGVLGDLRRQAGRMRRRWPGNAHGFSWDRRDGLTQEWWPQGLTTWQDSGAPPPAGRNVLLAGWYRRDQGKADTASRISVVDLGLAGEPPERPRYEHVLLVEAGGEGEPGTHGQVRLHAGGLGWWGHLLLVADTRRGLRVFDLRDVVRARRELADTHGCRYLLPQRARWVSGADGMDPLRWSFCSLDRTGDDGAWLVAGEYSRGGTGARLARFPLPAVPTEAPGRLRSVEVVTTDIASMQGACRVDGTYVVSASSGKLRNGHLWAGGADGFRQYPGALPVGPEDLFWDAAEGRLWTQTEYPGRRGVVAVPVPTASG